MYYALPELLEAGLLFFRRFMSMRGAYNKVVNTVDDVHQLFTDELVYHRRVVGEDVYLYVLGDSTLKAAARTLSISSDDTHSILIEALLNTSQRAHAVSVESVISTFGFELGRITQMHSPGFLPYMREHTEMKKGVTVASDPVLEMLQTEKMSIPVGLENLMEALGLPSTPVVASLRAAVKTPGFSQDWVNSIKNVGTERKGIHFSETFPSFVLAGAESAFPALAVPIVVLNGVDSLALMPCGLSRSKPEIIPYEMVPRVRTITKQMVDITSKREMERRGFVYLKEEREWYPVGDVTTSQKDGGLAQKLKEGISQQAGKRAYSFATSVFESLILSSKKIPVAKPK